MSCHSRIGSRRSSSVLGSSRRGRGSVWAPGRTRRAPCPSCCTPAGPRCPPAGSCRAGIWWAASRPTAAASLWTGGEIWRDLTGRGAIWRNSVGIIICDLTRFVGARDLRKEVWFPQLNVISIRHIVNYHTTFTYYYKITSTTIPWNKCIPEVACVLYLLVASRCLLFCWYASFLVGKTPVKQNNEGTTHWNRGRFEMIMRVRP